MMVQTARITTALFLSALSGTSYAEETRYGNFLRQSEHPDILYYLGQVDEGDYFDLRRAIRDQRPKLLVLHNPGGSVVEGLQIAAMVSDLALNTYIPPDATCASACSFIFLSGIERVVEGRLGVHQFFSESGGVTDRAATISNTQHTTAEIIGILNEFETPPFVFEKMFATGDIYFFNAEELSRINRVAGDEFRDLRLAANSSFPILAATHLGPVSNPQPAENEEAPRVALRDPADAELEAKIFALFLNQVWSLPNDRSVPEISSHYADHVDFYGTAYSKSAVLHEKQKFAARWPIRDYQIEAGSASAQCTSFDRCEVQTVVRWEAYAPDRGARSSGRSTWNIGLIRSGDGGFLIVSESGRVLSRN